MENAPKSKKEGEPAAIETISLSQVLLAPLDAIFKAQIHAARSFLNMLLQIGYPHQPVTNSVKPEYGEGKHYNEDFYYDTEINGKKETRKVSIPALALVPVAPLSVESANFKLEMRVDYVAEHRQIQESETKKTDEEQEAGFDESKRPWYLVSEPISFRGNIAPAKSEDSLQTQTNQKSTIQIEVKVSKTAMPAGLDKLLTFLTQATHSNAESSGQADQTSTSESKPITQ
jgi:hypothetical protein